MGDSLTHHPSSFPKNLSYLSSYLYLLVRSITFQVLVPFSVGKVRFGSALSPNLNLNRRFGFGQVRFGVRDSPNAEPNLKVEIERACLCNHTKRAQILCLVPQKTSFWNIVTETVLFRCLVLYTQYNYNGSKHQHAVICSPFPPELHTDTCQVACPLIHPPSP